jgi:hypothetical protein
VSRERKVCKRTNHHSRACKQWLSFTRADGSQIRVLLAIVGNNRSVSWFTFRQMFSGQAGTLEFWLVGSRSLAFGHVTIHLSKRSQLIGSRSYGSLVSKGAMLRKDGNHAIWILKRLGCLLASFLCQACCLPVLSVPLLLYLCSIFRVRLRRVDRQGLRLSRNELGSIWF